MMRRKNLLILLPLLIAFGVTGALAGFSSSGSGSATASTGTLQTPVITTATPGAGTVALSWATVTPPGSGTATYYVTRDGGAPAGDCPTSSSPTSATSCTDSGVSAGSHDYSVTVIWRSWTGTSTTSTVNLDSGAATKLVLVAATTTPNAGAADNLTITAEDSANNTVTSYAGAHNLTFGGASSIGSLNPTVTDSSGTAIDLGTSTAITFTNGVATVSSGANGVMTLYKAEEATITVTDGSIGNSGLAVTVSPAAANKLAFGQQPTDTVAGQTITPAPSVRILDQFGNLTSSTASVSLTPSSATLSGTASKPAVAGVASFSDLSMTAAGSHTLAAASADLAGATSSSFSISAAAGSKLVFTTSPQTATAGVNSGTITVQRQDQFDNPATNGLLTINLTTTSTGGVFRNTSDTATITTLTIANGVSSGSFLSRDTKAGTPTITATDNAGELTLATQQETITAAAASKLSFVHQPSDATAGVAINPAVTLQVQDQFGNSVSGARTVSMDVTSGPDSLTGGSTSSVSTSASGLATFSNLVLNTAGAYTITASSIGLTSSPASGSFNITAAAAAKLAFTQSPADTSADDVLSPQPKVTVQDQFGNPATTDSSTVTLSITSGTPTSGGPGSVSGCSQNESAGVVTFSNCKITTVGTAYKLHAIDGALTATDSAAFNITSGAATKLAITSPALSGTASSSATLGAISVQLQDSAGNPVSAPSGGVSVTLSSSSAASRFATTSGGATSSTLSVTIASGSSTTPANSAFYGDTIAGSPVITAHHASPPLLADGVQTESIAAGTASKLAITSTAVSEQASATATLGPITVQRQDQFSNATTLPTGAITVALSSSAGGTAAFSLTSGGATVTSLSIASGSSSANFFYGDTKAASPTITAQSAGLTAATQQETITAAAATVMAFINCSMPSGNTTCAGQPIAMGNNSNMTFNIQTQDPFGNPSTPTAALTISLSGDANYTIIAGTPATITPPANTSGQITARHNNVNATGTITAHVTSGPAFADATMAVKK
jgi:hypothetical protein